jgi:hypothetical protein
MRRTEGEKNEEEGRNEEESGVKLVYYYSTCKS